MVHITRKWKAICVLAFEKISEHKYFEKKEAHI